MKRLLLMVAVLMSGTALANPVTFLPPNNLNLEDMDFMGKPKKPTNGMTEEIFNAVIDEAEAVYAPIIKAHGGKLNFSRGWDDSTVNASASQSGDDWDVNMYGGLARRKEVTRDGFQMVVCHELGHHLAGFSFYDEGWAAGEGQSDYFSGIACSRMLWKDQLEENAKAKKIAHPTVLKQCDSQWTTEAERNLCYRTSMAGKSLADLLSALGGSTVDFDTPDTSEVKTTDNTHPEGQCRLDTYFAGALCTATFDPSVIPGRNNTDGQDSLSAQEEAYKASCSEGVGARPRCWFAPLTDDSKEK